MVPVTFGLVGELEDSEPDGGTWWMRFYSDDTEQMGLVTCSDALPKLYEDITEERMKEMVRETEQSMDNG